MNIGTRINIIILGSCVSRDILNQQDAGFVNLIDYYARSSLASLSSKKFSNNSLIDIKQIPTNFGKKMVQRDLNKDIFNSINFAEYDYLLIDLIDERFKVFYDENRTCCTISSELARSEFDFKTINGRTASLGTNLRWSLWQKGFQRLLNTIKHTNSLHKLILNKVYWSTHKDDGTLFENLEQINQANLFLQQMYAVIENEIPASQILKFDKSLFVGSTTHRWGDSPYHYINDYYFSALDKIKQLASYEVKSREICDRCTSFINEFSNKFSFINNTQFSENGRLLIEKSIYKVNGFADFVLDENIDWLVDPFNNRTWQWSLQQLSFLPYLINYYLETKDGSILTKAISLISSWARMCLNLSDEMVWHDHGTALRARNILSIYLLCKNSFEDRCMPAFNTATDLNNLVDVIKVHIDKLLDDGFYSKETNHGLDQNLFLFQICADLPQLDNSGMFVKIATHRINYELSHAFKSDGGHIENSPGYLIFGLKQVISAVSFGKIYFGDQTPILFDNSIFDNAALALVYMTQPNLQLPIIGDTASHKINKMFNVNLMPSSEVYNQFLYLISNCQQGVKPHKKLHVLPETGYVMYRDGWDSNGLHFVLKSGFHSTYHRHDDDTSFVLSAFGEEWLTDGGLYKHSATDKFRLYFRSLSSHNLSLPISAKASRNISEVNSKILFADETKDGFSVKATTNMIIGFNLTREINYIENKISIHDICQLDLSFQKSSTKEWLKKRFLTGYSSFVTRFIVPSGKKILRTDCGVIIRGKTHQMSITSANVYDAVSIRAGMDDEKGVCGWRSVKVGELQKAVVIEFRYSGEELDVVHYLEFKELNEC